MRRVLAVISGVLLAGGPAAAQTPPALDLPPIAPQTTTPSGRPLCAPPKLVRMTVRNVSPTLSAAAPAAQPRTVYRLHSTFLRSEESPDPTRGQAVVIVAEPDIWQINLATRTGQHALDPGPEMNVHAPILPIAPGMPPEFLALEYGCEFQFLQAAGAAAPRQAVAWGADEAGLHVVERGVHAISILMRREVPLMVVYAREGKVAFAIRYDAYRADLPDSPALFQPPKNVTITEAPRGGPPPKPTI